MVKNNLFVIVLVLGIFLISFASAELIVSEDVYGGSSFTRADAVSAIIDISRVIEVFKSNEFSYSYVQDKFDEANRTLLIADYAIILRNSSSTYKDKQKASSVIGLSSWKEVTYGSVVAIGNEILEREKTAFVLIDMLNSLSKKIEVERKLGVKVDNSESLFKLAQESFTSERYNETASLIEQSKAALERSKSEGAFARTIKNASLTFIKRYWIPIIVFIILFVILFRIIYRRVRRYNLIRKIERSNIELEVLNKLIIKAQTERYKDNKLSGIVYNIRVKKYKERIANIKEQLPVLEAKLKKLNKRKK